MGLGTPATPPGKKLSDTGRRRLLLLILILILNPRPFFVEIKIKIKIKDENAISHPGETPVTEAHPSAHSRPMTVREIYRELATRPIERQCINRTECCQFRLTGRTPFLTKGEALVAAKAVRASGRKQLPESLDGACPLLHRAQRGVARGLRGPALRVRRTHFCAAKPGGPYARQEKSWT